MSRNSQLSHSHAEVSGDLIIGHSCALSKRPSRTSSRCTASCCCATARWSPKDGGRPIAADRPHMLFSLSKSFTSSAIGLAVAEGRLSVDDPVLSFFPDDAPAKPSEHLAAMRVHDLLSMSTGHAEDTTPDMRQQPDGNWAKAFLARPVEHTPGTHFFYNSGATYMLSAIVQRLTGGALLDYLRPRLFDAAGHRAGDLGNLPARHQHRRLGAEHRRPPISRALASCICKRASGRARASCPRPGSRPPAAAR